MESTFSANSAIEGPAIFSDGVIGQLNTTDCDWQFSGAESSGGSLRLRGEIGSIGEFSPKFPQYFDSVNCWKYLTILFFLQPRKSNASR